MGNWVFPIMVILIHLSMEPSEFWYMLRKKLFASTFRWLLTQLGHVEGGVKFLVDLRAVLNKSSQGLGADDIVRVRAMNAELKSLLSHWFSAGLLTLEQVTWSSPCAMLQKVSDYEANHPLRNWTGKQSL